MNKKDIHLVRLISCLIENKKLKLGDKNKDVEHSFYTKYSLGRSGEKEIRLASEKRKIERYVKELYDQDIFQKIDGDYYVVNPNYLRLSFLHDSSNWKKLAETVLSSGEIDTYVMLRESLNVHKNIFMDDMKLKRYSNSIRELNYTLRSDKSVIHQINEAIIKSSRILVEYKGKKYSILPICYVISQDGLRTYLYYERKKRLEAPMELQYVRVLKEEEVVKEIDKEKFINQIRNAWDIEIGKSTKVKLLVRRGREGYNDVCDVLKSYLGDAITDREDYMVFSGEIFGIDDFKVWLRKYVDVCIVLEPDGLRNEIVNSLRNKIERYEG